jgi:CDP-diacylglycerol---glycerol-3-phosphate 3-phosphatidyltransferase
MNLPNALTLLRIFFVPLLVAALVQKNFEFRAGTLLIRHEMLALAIFLIAAATDLLDGYLARRWGQVTTVGTLLDPIADKLLISAALISLVQSHVLPAWMAILIVGREFAISGLRSIAAAEGYIIRANELGKMKLVFQVFAVSVAMLSLGQPEMAQLAMGCMWMVVLLTMWSAISYFHEFWREIDSRVKQRRRGELLMLDREERRAGALHPTATPSTGASTSSTRLPS